MSGAWQRFNLTQSEGGTTFTLKSMEHPDDEWTLAVSGSEGELELEGRVGEHTLVVHLRRRETGEFPLVARGFHWVNEYPNNR
ncbi:MAG: hypothetical protein JNK04_12720 [Myxococcales bacterium]|nr:hypothetical protein [Myxococcales bacterium]